MNIIRECLALVEAQKEVTAAVEKSNNATLALMEKVQEELKKTLHNLKESSQ
jgi:hypothetical protein